MSENNSVGKKPMSYWTKKVLREMVKKIYLQNNGKYVLRCPYEVLARKKKEELQKLLLSNREIVKNRFAGTVEVFEFSEELLAGLDENACAVR